MKLFFTRQSQLIRLLVGALHRLNCSNGKILRNLTLVLLCLAFAAFPALSHAIEKPNTIILPLKINSPVDKEALTQTVDIAFIKAAASIPAGQNIFTLLSRTEAEKAFDYNGSWPPDLEILQNFSAKTAPDITYIAAGSLTRLGKTVSIDIKIFDLRDPTAQTFYYFEGQDLADIESSLAKITKDILSYVGHSFIIASIAPEGNKRIDSGAILRNISSRAGDIYDADQLSNDLKNVFKMGYFDDVRLKVTDTEKGKDLVFMVKEKPVIGQVVISGNDELKEDAIREVISVAPNTILNPNKLREAVANILALYKSKGFYNTKATPELTYPNPEKVDIRFAIEEGQKIYIKDIRFAGNKSFKDSQLEKVMGTKEKGLLSWITDSGVLKQEILDQDAAKIAAFYQNNGYIEAMVGKPVVTQEGKWLYVTIEISEGDRYKVGKIELTGDIIGDKNDLFSLLKTKENEYLSRSVLREDILRLSDYYAEHGYAFAEAVPTVNTNKEDKIVDISIAINKGDLVYINRITIKGNTKTRDKVIRRALLVRENGVFDSKALRLSHEKLQRLDFFEEVSITPEPTPDKTKMDLVVEVKEKPTGAFSIGAGYSSVDNLMFMAEISQNNFLGRGERLALMANISGTSARYNLGFTEPHFYDSQLLVGFDLYNWMREYDTYTRDSTGFAVRFGYPLLWDWAMLVSYGYDDTNLTDVDLANAAPSIIESMNINKTSQVSLGFTRDTRNSLYVTTKGTETTIRTEYAGGFLGGDSQYTKVEAFTSVFFPGFFIDETAFHFKIAAGEVWENEAGKLPDFEKFYLGGINSLRGFPSRSIGVRPYPDNPDYVIGGQTMWFGNVEYLFPLVKQGGLRGVFFYDAGNVYENDWDFGDVKQDAGAGVRWLSPMGPMRLEWAYVIHPEPYEDKSNWEFSIGGAF
jgi:outer membrane protein insertion porin family